MPDVLVSLGANLGNSHATINAAALRLSELFAPENVTFSQLYSCPAIGGPGGQDDFHNAVAAVRFDLGVFDFWHRLRALEAELGRERRQRWESRRIDLDILMFDQLRLWTPHLKVPHPRMVTRSFAILPASDVLPTGVDPVSGMELVKLANRLPYKRHAIEKSLLISDIHERASLPRTILVICVGDELKAQLLHADLKKNSAWYEFQFISVESDISEPAFLDRLNEAVTADTSLVVLAISCPDPLNVAWEDFSRKWAQWLGFEEHGKPTGKPSYPVPKYLLNCFDLNWAIHELKAAVSAMNCELNIAQRGWTFPNIYG